MREGKQLKERQLDVADNSDGLPNQGDIVDADFRQMFLRISKIDPKKGLRVKAHVSLLDIAEVAKNDAFNSILLYPRGTAFKMAGNVPALEVLTTRPEERDAFFIALTELHKRARESP